MKRNCRKQLIVKSTGTIPNENPDYEVNTDIPMEDDETTLYAQPVNAKTNTAGTNQLKATVSEDNQNSLEYRSSTELTAYVTANNKITNTNITNHAGEQINNKFLNTVNTISNAVKDVVEETPNAVNDSAHTLAQHSTLEDVSTRSQADASINANVHEFLSIFDNVLKVSTVEDLRKTILQVSGAKLTPYDFKGLQNTSLNAVEMKLFSSEKDGIQESYQEGWLTTPMVYAFLEKITRGTRTKVVPPWIIDPATRCYPTHDWSQMDILLFPILWNGHWRLVAARRKDNKLLCYDSADPGWTLEDETFHELTEEDRDDDSDYSQSSTSEMNFDRLSFIKRYAGEDVEWTCITNKNCLKQEDDKSCGIFLMANASAIVNGQFYRKNLDVDEFRKEVFQKIVGACKLAFVPEKQCFICKEEILNDSSEPPSVKCIQCKTMAHITCLHKEGWMDIDYDNYKCRKLE